MKTIVIDAREAPGTTGRYIRKLLDNLQLLDHENDYQILLHPEAIDQVAIKADNFHVQVVKPRKFTIAEQLRLGGVIRNLKPDLVHFTMPNQPAFYGGKVVTTIYDLTAVRFTNSSASPLAYNVKRIIYSWLTKKVARKSHAIITLSSFAKNDVADYTELDQGKITVTPAAADKINSAPEPVDQLKGRKFIFYTGRAQPHKNLQKLIEAFEKLQSSHSDALLVFGGKRPGNYEFIEKIASSSSSANNIIFTDYISEGQLRWLYENAQAYVFPSLSEGFGLPGLEAMIHGCPVVSSNATCLPEVYGDAAHYFDPLNIDDMAQKINEVLDDQKLREELINKGHDQAAKYSWKRMAEQTLAIYNRVLNQ